MKINSLRFPHNYLNNINLKFGSLKGKKYFCFINGNIFKRIRNVNSETQFWNMEKQLKCYDFLFKTLVVNSVLEKLIRFWKFKVENN